MKSRAVRCDHHDGMTTKSSNTRLKRRLIMVKHGGNRGATCINTPNIRFVLPENYFVVFLSANNHLLIIFLAHYPRQFIVFSPLYPLLYHAAGCGDPCKSPLYCTAKLIKQAGVGCTIQDDCYLIGSTKQSLLNYNSILVPQASSLYLCIKA